MNKNFCYSVISFAIIVTIVLLVYFIMVFRSSHPLAIIWLYFTYYAGFIVSTIAAIYYMWSYKAENTKSEKSLAYNFTGTLNWITGIAGLLLLENGGLWFILVMLNLIIGFYIYKDIFTSQVK